MILVESKLWMNRQMHMMHEVDWICQAVGKERQKRVVW